MIVTSRMWQCAKALLQLSKFSLSVADLEDYRVYSDILFCLESIPSPHPLPFPEVS